MSVCRCCSTSGRIDAAACCTTSTRSRRFPRDLEKTSTDADDVQQLVDETHEPSCLRIDRLVQRGGRRVGVGKAQQVNRVSDRRERVPQLVGQHRQELVLPLAVREKVGRDARAVSDVVDAQAARDARARGRRESSSRSRSPRDGRGRGRFSVTSQSSIG